MIVAKRVANGWNQTQLNQQCGFPLHTIRDIENGKLTPTPGQLNVLNRVLKAGLKYEQGFQEQEYLRIGLGFCIKRYFLVSFDASSINSFFCSFNKSKCRALTSFNGIKTIFWR